MKRRLLALGLVIALTAAGCGGGGGGTPVATPLGPLESSWVPGQAALSSLPDFASLLQRATSLGNARYQRYAAELKAIEQARIEARKRARAEALRKYEEAKKRAERLYKEALRKAALARKRQEAELRRLKREREAKLRALLKKLRVKPGQECSLPEVRAQFDCRSGRLPLPHGSPLLQAK